MSCCSCSHTVVRSSFVFSVLESISFLRTSAQNVGGNSVRFMKAFATRAA